MAWCLDRRGLLASSSAGGPGGPGLLLACLVVLALAFLVGLPAVADAAVTVPSCNSDTYPGYSGNDQAADEARAMRNDVNRMCRVLSAVLANNGELTNVKTTAPVTLATGTTVTMADGSTVKLAAGTTVGIAGNVGVTAPAGGLPVAEQHPSAGTASLDPASLTPLVDATDASGNALHSDFWFLLGLLAVSVPAYFLVRLVMPRA